MLDGIHDEFARNQADALGVRAGQGATLPSPIALIEIYRLSLPFDSRESLTQLREIRNNINRPRASVSVQLLLRSCNRHDALVGVMQMSARLFGIGPRCLHGTDLSPACGYRRNLFALKWPALFLNLPVVLACLATGAGIVPRCGVNGLLYRSGSLRGGLPRARVKT